MSAMSTIPSCAHTHVSVKTLCKDKDVKQQVASPHEEMCDSTHII